MLAVASVMVERSPYMVRTSWTLGQSSATIADLAGEKRRQEGRDLISNWAPRLEAEGTFKERVIT